MINRLKHKIKILLGLIPKEPPFYTKDILIDENFEIGEYTYGHPNVTFKNDSTKLRVGKYCSIAPGVTIFLGGNHRIDWVTTYPFNDLPDFKEQAGHITGHPATKGDVNIGNDVWIGLNATILSGVTIGDGAVIAAQSVLSKDVGAYEIWGGNPAKFIKKRFSDAEIERLNELKWWDWPLQKVMDNVDDLCSPNINSLGN